MPWVCERTIKIDDSKDPSIFSETQKEFFSGVAIGGVVLWTKNIARATQFESKAEADTVLKYYARRFHEAFADARVEESE